MSRLHRRRSALFCARAWHPALRPLFAFALVGVLSATPSASAEKVALAARTQLRGTRGPSPSQPGPSELRAARLGLGDLKAAGMLLAGRTEPHWLRAAGVGDSLPGTLRFPVAKGHVTRGFGSGKGGYHQAVDIGGEVGLKVRAAGAGLVGYAGNGVSGYGNLVILVHPGGAITTYAHNQKNLVVSGQKVNKGAVLALLGSTGRSKGPHVHFELLFQGKNCDPMPLFRPAATRKNGAPAAPALSSWKQAHKRPKSIRCAPRKHHPDYVKRPELFQDDDDDEGADVSPP